MNLTVVRGRLSRPASIRELPSGTRLASLDVTAGRGVEGEPADSVPVVWRDPPASAESLDTDDEVVVVGRVRRRFFRAAGVTQSRTEVEADVVLRSRQRARVQRAVTEAGATLEDLLAG